MLDSNQVQPDENIQYNFAYLIDTSDSVGTDTLQQAKDAYTSLTKSLIEAGIADSIKFGIIPFGSDASLQTPANATEAISVIEGLSSNGFTNFNAALETANQFFSTAPSGAKNIAYVISDGYSTTGGAFEDSAKSLQEIADVQAYGFGPANIQELKIIDSDSPEIVPEASQLAGRFAASVGGLISSNPEDVDSNTDEDNDVDIASVPPDEANQSVENNSPDNTGQEVANKNEEKIVDDSTLGSPSKLPEAETPQTSPTSLEPEINNIAELGGSLDPLNSGEFPVVNVEDISIEEGDSGSSVAQFTVNLSSQATEEIQFSYETIDGSAISGSDYNQTSGQITIPIGETTAKIDVEVNGDSDVEPNEELTLKLNELSSATFANQQTEYSKVLVIENDDVQSSPVTGQNEASTTQIADDESIFDGNLLDLESYAGEVTIDFTVSGEASYKNNVYLYKVSDSEKGTITDPITGNQLNPSDGQDYRELAIKLREGLKLSPEGESSKTMKYTLSGGDSYGLLLIANGDVDSVDEDFSQVYFSSPEANSDGVEHIRSLGSSTLGFEDLFNGGDNDFNDVVISAEITDGSLSF
ncbi:MAG: VWA domain-containing protein [Cyanobacteriota bacterium]|nr:VWA domain-containing protein [Cyanobacteriota bacterium]